MGNEPGRLKSKHLDKNHVSQYEDMTLSKPRPAPSSSMYSMTTNSQKSSLSQLKKPRTDMSRVFEIANTLSFVQDCLDMSFAYNSNLSMVQNSTFILNEDDLEPLNVFNRETFGGKTTKKGFNKSQLLRSENFHLAQLSQSKSSNQNNIPSTSEKILFVDLNLSSISQKAKKVKDVVLTKEPQMHKEPSINSNQSDDRKSPQFPTKTPEDFQTANFTGGGLQNLLLNKSNEHLKNYEKLQMSHKASSENRLPTPNPRKNSKTESEFSDFSNYSYSETPSHLKEQKSRSKTPQGKSPVKNLHLTKGVPENAFKIKNNEKPPAIPKLIKGAQEQMSHLNEKPMGVPKTNKGANENALQQSNKTTKKSYTPTHKPTNNDDRNKVLKNEWNNKLGTHQEIKSSTTQEDKSFSKWTKKNSMNPKIESHVRENSMNASSDEEPLQIKISLDLKKFNKSTKSNSNITTSTTKHQQHDTQKEENNNTNNNDNNNNNSYNNEEKEFENNQFLKSVVQDIDKLTQKMLNTNNNLSGLNMSQVSDNNRKMPKKPVTDMHFSSNQQSETSESEYGKIKPILPNMKKK